MPPYSLIEYKLRRYIYLGHEHSMYIPVSSRHSVLEQRHHNDITGVRIIGKIVKKNKIEQINSVVPIILKIKKENKLYDDQLLIFALAVCARFHLKQCNKMVADAYAGVSSVCTDGLKLLMFVKFCSEASKILHNDGYLPNVSSGFGDGFRKAMNKWYLNRDPLLTTEQIIRHKSYGGWSHRRVMKLIHIHSDDLSRQIFIVHTMCNMEKVEKLFGSKLKDIFIENYDESFENKQLKFIYNFLKQVNGLKKMDENTLQRDIELHKWGHEIEIMPPKMLKSPKILNKLVVHMPLNTLLDNTFYFAKHRLFCNSTPYEGLRDFILRFNNTIELQKANIHPIESFVQYVKYSRTSPHIMKLQNNILKKLFDINIELPNESFKIFIETKEKTNNLNYDSNSQTLKISLVEEDNISQSTVKYEGKLSYAGPSKSKNQNSQQAQVNKEFNSTSKRENVQHFEETKYLLKPLIKTFEEKIRDQNHIADTNNRLLSLGIIKTNNPEPNSITVLDQTQSKFDVYQNQSNMVLLKPPPKLVEQLITFLSDDLIRKTLENTNPSGRRIIISYDSRFCMKTKMCANLRLLSVHEAITLIILSLIYPEKLPNKPTIRALGEPGKQCNNNNEIEIDYSQALTFSNLESMLFNASDGSNLDKKDIQNVSPISTIDWAKDNNKEYDVFVFLGSNKMNLRNMKKTIKEYQAFFKKTVKIVVCCLSGKHVEQRNLSRGNMLFVGGFDKNVGKVIDSFINEEF